MVEVVPGGGGIMTAADLALFYQGLLHNRPMNDGQTIWQPATLTEALRPRSGDYFPDHVVKQAKEAAEPIATF